MFNYCINVIFIVKIPTITTYCLQNKVLDASRTELRHNCKCFGIFLELCSFIDLDSQKKLTHRNIQTEVISNCGISDDWVRQILPAKIAVKRLENEHNS